MGVCTSAGLGAALGVAVRSLGRVRHTEFWSRMEDALGSAYSESWARQFVMSELGGRTAQDALDAGVPPKQVWAAVWRALDLPASQK